MRDLIGAAIVVVVIAVAVWFFAVYDTAAGRCSRGDLGACTVLELQQRARTPTPSPTIEYCYANCPDDGDVP